jgi:hypothetical protein
MEASKDKKLDENGFLPEMRRVADEKMRSEVHGTLGYA